MIKNLFLLGCTGLVAVALIELFLFVAPQFQAGEPLAKTVFCEGEPPEQQLSERFGRTGIPNGVFFRSESEADGWHLHAYNQDGFRDLIDTGDDNVLILGDSFIEGELVNNDRTIPYLLDVWNPDLAFRAYALGGYGTDDQLRIYQAIGGEIDHRLVVLGYFVGNDLADNLKAIQSSDASAPNGAAQDQGSFIFDLHVRLRALSRAYTFFYVNGRRSLLEFLGKPSLEDRYVSPENVEKGIVATGTRLGTFGDTVGTHGAELLIVTLPSWNELIGIEGEQLLAKRQRDLIQTVAETSRNVHVLDLKAMVEAAGYQQLHGRVDKHFNELGYYLVSKAIHEWINGTWRSDEAATPDMVELSDDGMRPDCAALPDTIEPLPSSGMVTADRISFDPFGS